MWKLWVILATLVLGCVYQLFPNLEAIGEPYTPPENGWGFPFSDMKLSPENWVFYLFQHVNPFLIAVVLFATEKKYLVAMLTYAAIQFVDLADHLLTFSEPWFDGPPTFNHIKVGIFGLSMLFEKKYGRQGI